MCNKTKTFRMPLVTYMVRKALRPKFLVLDFDDTVLLWPRNMKLPNGRHLNFSAYMSNIFAKIVGETLGIERDEAYELCLSGFLQYGSSMIGLMESEDYKEILTEEVLDDVYQSVHRQAATNPSKGLIAWATSNLALHYLLSSIKTPIYILTHGSTEYAKIGLKTMGLLNTVIPEENVFGMEMYGYANTKKGPGAYLWLQQRLGLPFNRMIMSEDSHKNLIYAKKLGMKTVLLHRPDEKGEPFPNFDYVDHTHQTLEDYLTMFLDKGINYTENKQVRSLAEIEWENRSVGKNTVYMNALMGVCDAKFNFE